MLVIVKVLVTDQMAVKAVCAIIRSKSHEARPSFAHVASSLRDRLFHVRYSRTRF